MARPAMKAIGKSGLTTQGGQVYEEFLTDLRGKRGIAIYTEMRQNDATIGGIMLAVKTLINQVRWDVIPADPNDQEAIDAAGLLKTAMMDMEMPFDDVIADSLNFLPYGFHLQEINYKLRRGEKPDPQASSKFNDGKIGWSSIASRSQTSLERWEFDENGRVLGFWQMSEPGEREKFIPARKLVHYRTDPYKNNPEGQSILRAAYRSWYMKKHIETIEAIGIERDMAGLPVVYMPVEYFDEENRTAEQTAVYNMLKNIVINVRRDEQEGLLLPSNRDELGNLEFEFTLIPSPGRRQFETGTVIDRWDIRILMSVLADFIMLGHDSVGSFALSSDKTDLFGVALGSFLKIIASTFNLQAVHRLMQVNAIPIEKAPRLRPRDIETASLEDLGAYIYNLTRAGFNLTDQQTEDYLRGQANLPTHSDAESVGLKLVPKTNPKPEIGVDRNRDGDIDTEGEE